MPTNLATALANVDASVAKSFADLNALSEAARQAQDSLRQAMRQAQRAAALVDFDEQALREFLVKPYLVRPLGNGQYELIVPRFIGFRAGWPVRHDGPYTVYLVSRFINMLTPLPDWLDAQVGVGVTHVRLAEDNALNHHGLLLIVVRRQCGLVKVRLREVVAKRAQHRGEREDKHPARPGRAPGKDDAHNGDTCRNAERKHGQRDTCTCKCWCA